MPKPTSPLQGCRSRTGFRHSRSRSRAVAPDTKCRHNFLRDYFLHPRATAPERERECRNSERDQQLCSGDVGFVTWRSSSNGKYNFWYAVLIKSVVPLKKREVSALVFVLGHNLCDDESKFFLTVPCTGESKFFLTVLYCTTRSSLRWIKDFNPTPLR